MIYLTPGPSQLYPTIKQHILESLEDDIPSLSHRSEKFRSFVKDIYVDLRKLLDIPDDYHVFFTASATEAMERIIQNCVAEKSFHFVNGSFAKRFYQTAIELKKQSDIYSVDIGKGFDFKNVKILKNTELIAFTHTETSGGTAVPMEEIYSIGKKNKKALIAVDVVSSIPYVNIDYKKVDLVFFSVQKGFGLPAGLGLLIVNPRAFKKAESLRKKGFNVGSYHKFQTMLEQAQKFQTIETPNVLDIYLLKCVLNDMLKKGIDVIREETEKKAKMIYTFFDEHSEYDLLVTDKKFRANTVIVISTPNGSKKILDDLKQKGFTVGAGYGENKEKQIRIANFPAHSLKSIKELLNSFSN